MKLTTLNKNHIIIINSSQTLGKEREESEREQPHATNVIGFSSLDGIDFQKDTVQTLEGLRTKSNVYWA